MRLIITFIIVVVLAIKLRKKSVLNPTAISSNGFQKYDYLAFILLVVNGALVSFFLTDTMVGFLAGTSMIILFLLIFITTFFEKIWFQNVAIVVCLPLIAMIYFLLKPEFLMNSDYYNVTVMVPIVIVTVNRRLNRLKTSTFFTLIMAVVISVFVIGSDMNDDPQRTWPKQEKLAYHYMGEHFSNEDIIIHHEEKFHGQESKIFVKMFTDYAKSEYELSYLNNKIIDAKLIE